MDLELPADLVAYLAELDEFIEREIRPLQEADDNVRFFDHRREDAPHRLGPWRAPEPGVGGPADGGSAPGGRSRSLPLPLPGCVRRA